ncbi:PAS domain S-box protein [Methylotenera sp.]|uniref:PAS domain S-box protein n=1 Tax=Methylotenera sp. TaxID=2051956 RepID=UPI00248933CA|nr:PAS domain S-box protein [Methylotenera sp.]MDI1298703.1 PAS domain S-box protein [Methylotenera sp.]
MPAAKKPDNEKSRLKALQKLNVLDSNPEEEFDAIVKAASLVCNVPIALISLVDEDRQWFKANVGLPGVTETPREFAFCAHAINQNDLLEVVDATKDERFSDNPLVVNDPKIRFYAGAPLRTSSGLNIGTLCVIDSKPHSLDDKQREILNCLATAAIKALEDRRARIAEQSYYANASYINALLTNAYDPFTAVDLNGIVTHWNPAAEALFGFPASAMIGESMYRFIPETELDELNSIQSHLKIHPEGLHYEAIRCNNVGVNIPVMVSLSPVFDHNGDLIGASKVFRDLREQKKAEHKLLESESRFRTLSETSPLGVFSTNALGECTYTNARWQQIFDLSLEESLGDGWRSHLHHHDRESISYEWQRCAESNIEFNMEFKIRRKDGSVRIVHSRARPWLDKDDAIIGFIGSTEDVTERKGIIDRLAYNEERVRKLYELSPVMLQSIDPQGRIVSVSDYWLDKHGYTRDEVIGRHTAEFMTPKDAVFATSEIIPKLLTDGSCENIAYQKVKKNGEIFDVLLSSVMDKDAQGKPIRSMSVLIDVTEENAAKRAKDELLNTIRSQYIMSMTDANGIIIEVNDAFCSISQYDRASLIGQNHRLVNSGTHPSAFFTKMYQTITAGKSWRGEICNRAKDGTLYWVDSVISPLVGNDGKIERYLSIRSDISKRKANELANSEQKQQIQQIIENQSVAMFMIDAKHNVIHWNHACEILTEISADLIIGTPYAWKGFYPTPRPCLADILVDNNLSISDQLYPSNCPSNLVEHGWHAEAWFENIGNKKRYLIFDAAPLLDTQGNIIGAIETLQDITASKLAEQALVKEKENLAYVIEATNAGTWQWNVATNECIFNDQWATLLGYSPEELGEQLFNLWISLTHPEDLAKSAKLLDLHFAGETDIYESEIRMRHKNGDWVWISTRGRVLSRTESGEPEWMFGTHTDINPRKIQEHQLVAANERITIATESSGVGIWNYDVVNDKLVCDSTMYKIYGLEEMTTVFDLALWLTLLHPDDLATTQQAFEKAIAGKQDYDLEFRTICPERGVRHIKAKSIITRDINGRALHMLGTNLDITDIRKLSIALAEQHELLKVTMNSIGDAVITTDAKGYITWLNPAAERMTGWLSSEALSRRSDQVFHIVHEETRKPAENPISTCLKSKKKSGLANQTILLSRNGEEFGIEDSASPITNKNNEIVGVVLVFHDVTEQRRISQEMSHRATHDPLTGLVNRAEFETRLNRVLKSAHDSNSQHALMFIDLDQFKLVNDACGHSAGDMLLKQVSNILQDIIRNRDTLARLGGDEFGVILEQCDIEHAQRVAEKICERMDNFRFIHDAKRFRIGTSIGLSPLDNRWTSVAAAMQAADTSCYAAKEAGRNRVHTWFDTDQAINNRKGDSQWATRIEQAIDNDQFMLYVQRIEAVNPNSKDGLHAEILLRLKDEQGNIVLPSIFIPASERFHLASRIDRWVLTKTVEWLTQQADLSIISTICINLSGQSVGDRAFHRQAIEILALAGSEICKRICLEITETAAISNLTDASLFIEQLSNLGVRIALDDFGAGASSFGYLKTLKIDILKIDGQFIKAMMTDLLDDSAVRCFIDVANILGLKTVAEYVENEQILERVKELGVDYAQGYLLHKPEPITSFKFSKSKKVEHAIS